jgi:hypothetical protein
VLDLVQPLAAGRQLRGFCRKAWQPATVASIAHRSAIFETGARPLLRHRLRTLDTWRGWWVSIQLRSAATSTRFFAFVPVTGISIASTSCGGCIITESYDGEATMNSGIDTKDLHGRLAINPFALGS